MEKMDVLLATDGSTGAIAAARWVVAHLPVDFVHLTLLTVVPVEMPTYAESVTLNEDYGPYFEAKNAEARRRGQEVLDRTCGVVKDFQPRKVVLTGAVVSSILGYLGAHALDLVVVGRRGHSLLMDVLIGSVSLGLVERSPVPVLVIQNDSAGVGR